MIGPKKIAIVSDGFPPTQSGGIATCQHFLLEMFRSFGHECRGFSYDESAPLDHNDAEIVRKGAGPFLTKTLAHIPVFPQLRDTIRCSLTSSRLFESLQAYHPDIIIFPDQGAPAFFWWKKIAPVYVLTPYHNPYRFVSLSGTPNALATMDAKITAKIEGISFRNVDYVISPTSYMQNWFTKTYPGQTATSQIIPSPCDLDQIIRLGNLHKTAWATEASHHVYIPSAGNPIKGHAQVTKTLLALRRMVDPNVKIAFYCSGNVSQTLVEQWQKTADNFTFFTPGHIHYEKHLGFIAATDICLSPTLEENFSLAMLEAQALGKPMVTFDVGGNREMIVHEKTGLLAPLRDFEKLGQLLATLISSTELTENLGNAAFKRIQEFYSFKAIYEKYKTLLGLSNA